MGHLDYANGKTYDGQWLNDLYHGLGDLTFNSGPIKYYKGEWEAGKRSGHGTLKLFNKLRFEGGWADDLPHGSGCVTFESKVKLEAKFVHGRIEGKCTIRCRQGDEEQAYVGVYKDGFVASTKNPPIPIGALPSFVFWF